MRPRVIQVILIGAFSLGLAETSRPLWAAADVAAESPFLPPGNGAAAAAVTDGAPIELRGIMTMPDGLHFSIFDPAKKSSTWVRLNERGAPYLVRTYGIVDGADQVKVEYQGSTLTLGLKAAKIVAMAPGQMIAAAGPGGPMARGGNAITNSVVVNPTPADEAARLQAVVEAVAARRAARNQANQMPQAGGIPSQTVAPANSGQTNVNPRRIQRQQQQSQQQP